LLVEPIGLLRAVDPHLTSLPPLNFEVGVLLPVNAGENLFNYKNKGILNGIFLFLQLTNGMKFYNI
ncbi:hypothetical protein P4H04_21235, partial [Bacillus cereus]|nr:hypothetical protein [Bacillus cereus]